MARLKFPQRFGLITLLFLLPLGIALFMLMSRIERDVAFAENELRGTAYLRPAHALFRHALSDWLLSQSATRGLDTNDQALKDNSAQIDRDFEALLAADARYGTTFGTTDKLNALKADWDQFKALPYEVERQVHYKPFVMNVLDLIATAGDKSNLVLDSDLDTHYTMQSLVVALPRVQFTMAQLGVLGDAVAGRRNMDERDRAQLNIFGDDIIDAYTALRRDANVAFANNTDGNLQRIVEPSLEQAATDASQYVDTLSTQLLDTPVIIIPLDSWMGAANTALNSSNDLWDTQVKQMDSLVQRKVDSDAGARNLALFATAAVLLLVVYMWVGFYQAVMRTITGMEEASRRLAAGLLVQGDEASAAGFDLGNRDELSRRAAAALSNMALATSRLNSTINARTHELTEVSVLLAYMHEGLAVLDAWGNVKVLNAAAIHMLGTTFDGAVGKPFADLVGDNRVRGLLKGALESPAKRQSLDVALGGRVVNISTTFVPVADEGGHTGMAVLQDVTELRALQMMQQASGLAAVTR
jgi:sigma-B regulation protein RsbU (phosphoserine phosphatase)